MIPKVGIFLLLVALLQQAAESQPILRGGCEPFRHQHGACKDILGNMTTTYVADEMTQDVKEAQLVRITNEIMPIVLTDECREGILQTACGWAYPPCQRIEELDILVPKSPCQKSCKSILGYGTDISGSCYVETQLALDNQERVPPQVLLLVPRINEDGGCEATYGDTSYIFGDEDYFDEHISFARSIAQYEGQPIFTEASSDFTYEGKTYEIACYNVDDVSVDVVVAAVDCYLPFVESELARFSDEDCPDWAVTDVQKSDGTWVEQPACTGFCAYACPHFAFTDETYSLHYVAYILPGLLSIPMNFYISGSYLLPGGKAWKAVPMALKLTFGAFLAFGLLNVIPASAMFTDMVCRSNVDVARATTPLCGFHRYTFFLLQMAMLWLMFATVDIWSVVVMELKAQQKRKLGKAYVWLGLIVPIIFGSISAAIDNNIHSDPKLATASSQENLLEDLDYPLAGWNRIRDAFTCQPFYRYLWQEVVFFYLPFAIAGIVSTFCAFSIGWKIITFSRKTMNGGSKRSKGESSISSPDSQRRDSAALSSFNNGAGKFLARHMRVVKSAKAERTLVLGFSSAFLVVIRIISTVKIVSSIDAYSLMMEALESCSYRSQSDCGVELQATYDARPSSEIMTLSYLSFSLLPLVSCVVFIWDKKHQTSWRNIIQGNRMLNSVFGRAMSAKAGARASSAVMTSQDYGSRTD